MAGSVFFVVLTIIAVLLGLLVNPFFLIPAVVFVVVGLFTGGILKKATDTAIMSDNAPSGTATTSEASYDPSGGNTR
jgi:hypothetical protein